MYGLTAYVYLRYHFNDPTQTPPYPIYTTDQELIAGSYDIGSNSVLFEGRKFTYNGTEYTVCGIDYAIYSGGQYVIGRISSRPDIRCRIMRSGLTR